MKQIYILLLINFPTLFFSQKIEMSLVWKEGVNMHWKDTSFNKTPYLKIKYINNSRSKIYFEKLSSHFNFTPFNPHGSQIKNNCIISKKQNKKYYVIIRRNSYNWDVIDYEKRNEKELYDSDFIQGNILQCIYKRKNIIKRNMRANIKNNLIFLKGKSNKEEYFDLTGFAIVGGEYTFTIPCFTSDTKNKIKVNGYNFFQGEIKSNELKVLF